MNPMLVEKLSDQIRERLVSIPDSAPLMNAARLLRPGTDIVLVCDARGILVGVITKTDVVSQIGHCEGSSCMTLTSLVMTRCVVTCSPSDWLQDVWATMKQRRLKNIPVVDSKARPLGVLNARDALESLLGEVENEETLLRDYVMSVGYH